MLLGVGIDHSLRVKTDFSRRFTTLAGALSFFVAAEAAS
jgi:hypothetical protein